MFSLLDEKGKVYGEMNGGEPNAKIPDPDRYKDLFPANVVLGTYWIDLFPHEAQKLNLTVNASTRTVQGHELVAKFDWSIPLKDDWQPPEGGARRHDRGSAGRKKRPHPRSPPAEERK